MFRLLSNLYGGFFSAHNWVIVFGSSNAWILIFSLILMECLLSVDNAVVLAAQTQILPTHRMQRRSLFYGIWGAYLFRFLVIGLGTYLIHFWEIKILGSLYLGYIVYRFFRPKPKAQNKSHQRYKGHRQDRFLFWRTVCEIELMDIMFSMDSILAGLAISANPVIVFLGGIIGITVMRGVAEVIIALMRKIPELQPMAYVLISVIAVKLFLSIPVINVEISPAGFGLLVLVIFLSTVAFHFCRKSNH